MSEKKHKEFNENNDIWKDMFENQGKIFDIWMKSMPFFQPNGLQKSFGESFENMMEEWRNNQQKLMGFWQGNSDKNNNNSILPFNFNPFISNPQEIPRKWNEFFEEWFKLGNFSPQSINESTNPWMKTNRKFMEQFFSQNTGEPLSTFLLGITEVGEAYAKTLENFMKPWMESYSDLQNAANKAMQGDRNAYIDFLRQWQQAFQDSYGRLFNIPSLGFNRETNEKILKSLDAYFDYIYSSNEFAISVSKVGYDAMDRLTNKIKDSYEKGNPPETFKEFYDLWIETNEEVYLNLFRQEGFAKMLGDWVDAGVSFKRRFDDLTMEVFSQLPIPTDHDMDSVYSKIYEMNKEIKAQKSRMEELNKQMEEFKSKSLMFTKTT